MLKIKTLYTNNDVFSDLSYDNDYDGLAQRLENAEFGFTEFYTKDGNVLNVNTVNINAIEVDRGERNVKNEPIRNKVPLIERDKRGNITHYKNSDGYEWWCEYDEHENTTYYKHSNGIEFWQEYDEHSNLTHYKDSDGNEFLARVRQAQQSNPLQT
jgi:YD repeat-containing protein